MHIAVVVAGKGQLRLGVSDAPMPVDGRSGGGGGASVSVRVCVEEEGHVSGACQPFEANRPAITKSGTAFSPTRQTLERS